MITGAILGCYALAWLFTARSLYHRWRSIETSARDCAQHGSPARRRASWKPPDCCFDKAALTDSAAAAAGIGTGLLWPAVLLVAAIRFRPPPTAAERAEENVRLTKRIGELEREAGIKP